MMFDLMPMSMRDRDFMRIFDEFDRNFFRSALTPAAYSFRTNLSDEGDQYKLEAELPGFKKEEVEISIEDGILTIHAAHDSEKEDNSRGYLCRERHCGSYERCFRLNGVDEDSISAGMADGVLTLMLPKKKEEKPAARRIELA